jgi:hypothetical protein
MATPFPFVSGQILTAAQMNSIGEAAVSFTPTFTNYTRGNGTSIAYYTLVNKLCYVYVQETLGTTSIMGTGPEMTLPVTAARTTSVPITKIRIDDTGANVFFGTILPGGATSIDLYADNSAGTYLAFATLNETTPMTWKNTDKFSFGFVYETA